MATVEWKACDLIVPVGVSYVLLTVVVVLGSMSARRSTFSDLNPV